MTPGNPNCDGCSPDWDGRTMPTQVRVLPLGGGANHILCRCCYRREIQFRKSRNRELSKEAQYDLPDWEDLNVYEVGDGQARDRQVEAP